MCEPPFAMNVTFSFGCLGNSTNRNGPRTRCVLAGLCAMLPRTCYTTTFADSVTAATIVPNAGESMPSFLNRANYRWVEESRFVSPRHFAELF